MRTELIVTADVTADFFTGLDQVNVIFEIDLLVLQAAPQAFYSYT